MTKFLNISRDNTMGGNSPSHELLSSQRATKEYIDSRIDEYTGLVRRVSAIDINSDGYWEFDFNVCRHLVEAIIRDGVTDITIGASTDNESTHAIIIDNIDNTQTLIVRVGTMYRKEVSTKKIYTNSKTFSVNSGAAVKLRITVYDCEGEITAIVEESRQFERMEL